MAAVVLLVVLVAAYWYWLSRDTIKLALASVTVAGSGVGPYYVTMTGTYSGKRDEQHGIWPGKKASLHAKGLLPIKGVINSVAGGSGTWVVSISGIMFPTPPTDFPYTAVAGDYFRVYLKW